MKTALRQGDYRAVNLYVLKNLTQFGTSTNPITRVNDTLPRRLIEDGVIVQPEVVPGGSHPTVNEGKTAPHEIGHWFGLLHTFTQIRVPPNPPSGCIGPGDEVEDTPREREAVSFLSCPEGRDSCPNDPGLDPIHNYMDYSRDSCLTEFTAGQQWVSFSTSLCCLDWILI
jgi:hypothetical protein